MGTPDGYEIEAVWGRLEGDLAERVVRLWLTHSALDEARARERLRDVVCVLLDREGEVAGVNSVYDALVPLIGNRRFWIYRMFLSPRADPAAGAAMVTAAHEELGRDFDPSGGGPIGLCVLVDDRDLMRRHPEAVWPDSGLLYAGYTADGKQVRIGYFEGAVI